MGILTSLSKAATSTALHVSEVVLLFFGVVLVIGLIGEYAESEPWEKWTKLFEMLVIIGVAGELLADGGIFLFSRQLEVISEVEIAALNKEAGDAREAAGKAVERAAKAEDNLAGANERAAKAEQHAAEANTKAESFRRDIATSNQRAAEANLKAEEGRLATHKIEEHLADRTLTDDQLKAIVNDMSRFSGQEYGVFAVGFRPEVTSLAMQIMSALNRAGWKFTPNEGHIESGFVGLNVNVQSTADAQTKEAAASLVAALRRQGIASNVGWYIDPPKGNKINIAIGAKN